MTLAVILGRIAPMTGRDLGMILGAIRTSSDVAALDAITRFLVRRHAEDDATRSLLRLIAFRRRGLLAVQGDGTTPPA